MTLAAAFATARQDGRAAFIPYVMAGDPDLETTASILKVLQSAGADAVELGIPYSDALADGPTIVAAATRALANGVGVNDVLNLARRAAGLPVVLFSYFNPILQYGLDRFARAAAGAGVAGVIVPDIPLEESETLGAVLFENGLAMPLLVAPSTGRDRARRIADRSTVGYRFGGRQRTLKLGVYPQLLARGCARQSRRSPRLFGETRGP